MWSSSLEIPAVSLTILVPQFHSETCGQKIDEGAIEIMRRFFVREMTYAFECNQADIAKILAEGFGGLKINGTISRSPHEQSRVIANFRQRRLQFGEVGCPIFYDLRRMT